MGRPSLIKKNLILIFFSVGWFSFSSADPGNYNSITGRLIDDFSVHNLCDLQSLQLQLNFDLSLIFMISSESMQCDHSRYHLNITG